MTKNREFGDPQVGASIRNERQVFQGLGGGHGAVRRRGGGAALQAPGRNAAGLYLRDEWGALRRERVLAHGAFFERDRSLRMLAVELEGVIPGRFRVDLPIGELRIVLDLPPLGLDRQREDQWAAFD